MKIPGIEQEIFQSENSNSRSGGDFGLGNKVARKPGTRLIHNDGTFNVVRRGLSKFAPYQNLVEMSWPRFIAVTLTMYVLCNMVFALGFYLIGTDQLNGAAAGLSPLEDYLQCFYFSIQTFTTVGYGALAPLTLEANALAAVLALFGWIALALATGLFFARFSRPSRLVIFSDRAIISPYHSGLQSLQFRLANKRDTNLINLRASVVLTWLEESNGELHRRFRTLDLERDFVSLFPLNWTIVHPITDGSPLAGWTRDDHRARHAELLVSIEGYDRTFAQQVSINTSYTYEEIEWNARFQPMYQEREATTELYLNRISAISPVGEEE